LGFASATCAAGLFVAVPYLTHILAEERMVWRCLADCQLETNSARRHTASGESGRSFLLISRLTGGGSGRSRFLGSELWCFGKSCEGSGEIGEVEGPSTEIGSLELSVDLGAKSSND
jgi:hypothetical protein